MRSEMVWTEGREKLENGVTCERGAEMSTPGTAAWLVRL